MKKTLLFSISCDEALVHMNDTEQFERMLIYQTPRNNSHDVSHLIPPHPLLSAASTDTEERQVVDSY